MLHTASVVLITSAQQWAVELQVVAMVSGLAQLPLAAGEERDPHVVPVRLRLRSGSAAPRAAA